MAFPEGEHSPRNPYRRAGFSADVHGLLDADIANAPRWWRLCLAEPRVGRILGLHPGLYSTSLRPMVLHGFQRRPGDWYGPRAAVYLAGSSAGHPGTRPLCCLPLHDARHVVVLCVLPVSYTHLRAHE